MKTIERREFLRLASGLVLVSSGTSLIGCGGVSPTQPGSDFSTNSSGDRSIIVTIQWPKPSSTRLIPAAAVKVVLEVKNGETLVTTKEVNKSDADASGTTHVKLDKLPAGNLVLTATAYGSEGAAQAKGQTSFTTKVGTPASTTVEMFTTIATLTIKPADSGVDSTKLEVAEGATLALIVEAKNANGDVVLTSPEEFIWESFNPAVVEFKDKTKGVATGVSASTSSSAEVTVKYIDTKTHTPVPNVEGNATIQVSNDWSGDYISVGIISSNLKFKIDKEGNLTGDGRVDNWNQSDMYITWNTSGNVSKNGVIVMQIHYYQSWNGNFEFTYFGKINRIGSHVNISGYGFNGKWNDVDAVIQSYKSDYGEYMWEEPYYRDKSFYPWSGHRL